MEKLKKEKAQQAIDEVGEDKEVLLGGEMMEFQEFWKSYKKMCDKHSTCENCPMNGMRFDCNSFCVKAIEKNPQQAE